MAIGRFQQLFASCFQLFEHPILEIRFGSIAAPDCAIIPFEDRRRLNQRIERTLGGGAIARMRRAEQPPALVEFRNQIKMPDDRALRFFINLRDQTIVFFCNRVIIAVKIGLNLSLEALSIAVDGDEFVAAANEMH